MNPDEGELRRREAATGHSERFRKVSNRYPRRVAEAYAGDLERAAADSDEEVAATVRAWEIAQGLEPRDWEEIGAEERDSDADPLIDVWLAEHPEVFERRED
jgi:hypothetical protein